MGLFLNLDKVHFIVTIFLFLTLTSFLVLQPLILNSTFGQIGSGLYSSSISSITATGGLEAEMRRIEKSDAPADIATLDISGATLLSA